MSMKSRQAVILIVVYVLVGSSSLPLIGSSPTDDGQETRGLEPLDVTEVWSDSLDDMSNVLEPDGGLVGVELSMGEVRLKPGSNRGWIASSVIKAKPSYRYDFVLLDASLPGNSFVEISILDASKAPSEVGFANETVENFKRKKGIHLSVLSINPVDYPEIRIQVDLIAEGQNKPVLHGWSLYYIPYGEWRDEFLGRWKMNNLRGINITEGTVELNLTRRSSIGGFGDYDPFPPVMLTRSGQSTTFFNAIYPNAGNTGYRDSTNVSCNGTRGIAFDDLDGDGHLDLVCANWLFAAQQVDSQIYWGNGTGTWSPTSTTELYGERLLKVDTGDFNGDGEVDIVFSAAQRKSLIFMNKGRGDFDYVPNIQIDTTQGRDVATGDLNNDGYDDIVLATWDTGTSRCLFGNESWPDTAVDIALPVGNKPYRVIIHDMDEDGYEDVVFATGDNRVIIFMGGENGPDTTIDYSLTTGTCYDVAAGNVNGDEYTDLVVSTFEADVLKFRIFEGTSQGWNDTKKHDIVNIDAIEVELFDINNDGYDDILTGTDDQFHVYYGGEIWPSSPDITVDCYGGPQDIAIGVPKDIRRGFVGSFVTEEIKLPPDNKWDLLHLEGTMPNNTTMWLSVFDSSGMVIPGFKDLTDWTVDLTPLSPDMHSTIKVRVFVISELNDTTPTMDFLIVKWMDKMTWREQFYGPIRVDRMLGFDIRDGQLHDDATAWSSPQLIFSSLKNDDEFNTKSWAYFKAGGLDYLAKEPMGFNTNGIEALDVADVNGDGFLDVVFAQHRTTNTNFSTQSPLFVNSPTGWRETPDMMFSTIGAKDVLLKDLNGDTYFDVVFAQEQDNGNYNVNSTLFWGSENGWNSTPDVNFTTKGASGVEAADFNGDGRTDLVFACNRDDSGTSINSMVFLQVLSGFNGASPSHLLPTKGARAVAVGDLDGDSRVDLVFANNFSGGLTEINSMIYWGKAGGGFEAPTGLPTVGAEDVKVADLDNDDKLDIVFANSINNAGDYNVSSYVYLNDGSGGFGSSPDTLLPTVGATAVAVGDLDGSGRLDLVFACHYNGTSYDVPSVGYLGGGSGWSSTPDFELPTMGVSDVKIVQLVKAGLGGYMSRAITPEEPTEKGTFHTFRYDANIGASQTGRIQLIDAITHEILVETSLQPGPNEWVVEGAFPVKVHSSIRVVVIAEGLDQPGAFEVDNLWLNWTKRVHRPPQILDLQLSTSTVYRSNSVTLWINATDEYDPPKDLRVIVEYRLNGTIQWITKLMNPSILKNGAWTLEFRTRIDTSLGLYDFKVSVKDSDWQESSMEFHNVLEVFNNIPTAPEVHIAPDQAVTTSPLRVEIVIAAYDVENSGLTYRYQWYLDGDLMESMTSDTVDPSSTHKGQNWSVEVRSFDGEDEGHPAWAWKVIQNMAPVPKNPLPNPEIDEDWVDTDWLNLMGAFEDLDGDPIIWTVNVQPQFISVEIDDTTGQVTLRPKADWNGRENVTFVASDGELQATQTVTVNVHPVNDIPRFVSIDGNPIDQDPLEYTIKQYQLLTIDVLVVDVEGNELVFDANTTLVEIDSMTGDIRFEPDNDAVGTHYFSLTVWDIISASEKVSVNFKVVVENVNDVMEDPRITNPSDGDEFLANQSFLLSVFCSDPDTQHGQELNFTWTSNSSGLLGYGSSLTVRLLEPGVHVLTVTVTDGEFEKIATIGIIIEEVDDGPPPNGQNGDDGKGFPTSLLLAVLVILGIVAMSVFFVVTKSRAEREEAEEEALFVEEEKREALERARMTVKRAADQLEVERGTVEIASKEGGGESDATEEVELTSLGVPETTLSMESKKTAAPSAEVQKLFDDMEKEDEAVSEEELEEMRLDNLKRKYQNAIGRLPYGIPSEKLKEWDWVELAAALATGDKKTLPDGMEATEIDGRWYYSDDKDTSTFLKEHGAKPRAEPKKKVEVTTDREMLLAKLEERFILGEISEEAYNNLVDKYSKE
jgi:hypothetical protein